MQDLKEKYEKKHGFSIFFHVVPAGVRRAYVVIFQLKPKVKQVETSEKCRNPPKSADFGFSTFFDASVMRVWREVAATLSFWWLF